MTATLTHRVTLSYQYGGITHHNVAGGEAGLRHLAAANPTAVRGHAVILDRERHGTHALVDLKWTAEFLDTAACTHPRLAVDSDHATMDYHVSCRNCGTAWVWDDLHIPANVRDRAMPIWEQHGL